MSDQLDELFSKIRNGKTLLSAHEMKAIAADFTKRKTEKLMLEALLLQQGVSDLSPENLPVAIEIFPMKLKLGRSRYEAQVLHRRADHWDSE